jgi:hypothetical protein
MEYMTQEQYKAYRQKLRDQGYATPESTTALPPPKPKMKEFLDQDIIKFLHGLK